MKMQMDERVLARKRVSASLAAIRAEAEAEDKERRATDPDYKALAERRDAANATREIARVTKRMQTRIQKANEITELIVSLEQKATALEATEPRRVAVVLDQIAEFKFKLSDLRRDLRIDEEELQRKREAAAAL